MKIEYLRTRKDDLWSDVPTLTSMTKEKKESEYVYLYPLIIMAVGFGKSTQTVEQIVRNQIKQKEIIKYADVEGRRQDYNNTGNGFINHFLDNISKKDLLNPQ